MVETLTDRMIARINELEERLRRLEASDRKLGDIQLTLGDTAGANKLTLRNSTPTEVFAVDSRGAVMTDLVAAGPVSETAKGYDNFRMGVVAGTPRIVIEDAGSTQWEIDNNAGTLRFFNPGVVKATLNTSGVFTVTSGVGFPATQSASGNANTLDDYEEGTWTPTDGSGASLSFTTDSCQYAKIGQLVIASFNITYPATASGATAIITGLPFTTQNTTDWVYPAAISYTTYGAALTILIQKNSTSMNLYTVTGAAIANSAMSGKVIRGAAMYRASA